MLINKRNSWRKRPTSTKSVLRLWKSRVLDNKTQWQVLVVAWKWLLDADQGWSPRRREDWRHRRDYMGRVHVHTLLSALPRIFPSLPVSSDLHLRPSSSSFFYYFFLFPPPPPAVWRACRAQFISTPRPIICCFRSEGLFSTGDAFICPYSNLFYVKRNLSETQCIRLICSLNLWNKRILTFEIDRVYICLFLFFMRDFFRILNILNREV